jgi:hypothetical protein
MAHRSSGGPRAHACVLAALAAATALVLAPAAAATASTDSAGDSVVTWSVRPADESGLDGRSWVELEVEPGTTTAEHLALRNLGDAAVTFAVAGADGYFTPTGRFNMLASGDQSIDAGTWIEVADSVTVDAGGTTIVPFTVTVPADATPGDHAAGIAASISSESATGGTTVGVESRVGFRVMVRVKGEIEPDLQVSASGGYVTDWNPFDPGSVALDYTLTNAGNVRMSAGAGVTWEGRRLGDGTDGEPTELLPADERAGTVRIPGVWPLGIVTVPLVTEQAVVMPDGTVQELEPLTRSVTIWAVPWPQLLVAAAVALMLSGLLYRRRRHAASIAKLVDEARAEGRRQAQGPA